MGGTLGSVAKTLSEQASIFRHRQTYLNQRQSQTNSLLKGYFGSTLILLATQVVVTSQENNIYNKYTIYRKKIEREREFVKETL